MDAYSVRESYRELAALTAARTSGLDEDGADAFLYSDANSDNDSGSIEQIQQRRRPRARPRARAPNASTAIQRFGLREVRTDRVYEPEPMPRFVAPPAAPGTEGAPPMGPPGMGLGEEQTVYYPSPDHERVERELGPLPGPCNCFACREIRPGNRNAPVCQSGIKHIRELVAEAGGVDDVQLARDIADLYERKIRTPANKALEPGEEPYPEWSAASVYAHFFTALHRRVDPVASVTRRLLFLEQCFEDLSTKSSYAQTMGPDGPMRMPDERRLKLLRDLNKDINSMYSLQLARMPLITSDTRPARVHDCFQRRMAAGSGGQRHY